MGKNINTNEVPMSGESYIHLYTSYKHRDCLDEGVYEFMIEDFTGNGMQECFGGGVCGYSLRVDGKTVKEGQYFGLSESTEFECIAPSSSPTYLVDNWSIVFDRLSHGNKSTEFMDGF